MGLTFDAGDQKSARIPLILLHGDFISTNDGLFYALSCFRGSCSGASRRVCVLFMAVGFSESSCVQLGGIDIFRNLIFFSVCVCDVMNGVGVEYFALN